MMHHCPGATVLVSPCVRLDFDDPVLLQDYWLSIDRFVNWSSSAVSKDDFYTDQECRTMYKNHLNTFVHRKNTVNGRIYKEDPTIFYWNLINEPRW